MITRLFASLVMLAVVAVSAEHAMAKGFVIPHVLEKSGSYAAGTPFTFDTTIFMTYAPGVTDGKPPKGVVVSLYLYDNAGLPLKSGTGQDVCNPCGPYSFTGAPGTPRRVAIALDDLFAAKGGFASPNGVVTGFGVATFDGDGKSLDVSEIITDTQDASSTGALRPAYMNFTCTLSSGRYEIR